MNSELKLHLDQHLLDRMEALWLLYQESSPAPPLGREELLRIALEAGLRGLLQDLLVTPPRRSASSFHEQRSDLVTAQVA